MGTLRLQWIKKTKPPIVILENVCSAPWEKVKERFNQAGYHAQFTRLDTKQFYIPHTRTRVYLMAVLKVLTQYTSPQHNMPI